MKHAIIILAHKESENLFSLIKYFDRECDVFIHFDRKSGVTPLFLRKIENMPQVVKVFRKYTINWGGFSMLKCEMYMLERVLSLSDAEHIHLLSGQDYPIKPLHEFLSFFENHYGMNFISYTHLPNTKWQGNTFHRITYFYPTDIFSSKEMLRAKTAQYIKFQRRWGIKRNIPLHFDHIYGGSQWFSLSRIGAKALVDYTSNHKLFYWRFMFTFAPEEVYIQTVLVNILPHNLIVPHNFRFIRWQNENGNNPSNLGKEHFHLLAATNDLFARKFEEPYSNELIPLINQFFLHSNDCKVKEDGTWIYNGYIKYRYEERFADAIAQYVKWIHAKDVVDAGCGAGFLVAALRRRDILATGFDTNPFTPELSSRLLPQNDTLCYQASLTKPIKVDTPFDVAMCLDVLQYIPAQQIDKAIQTLVSMTAYALIVSFEKDDTIPDHLFRSIIMEGNFNVNKMATSYLRSNTVIYKNLVVLEKREKTFSSESDFLR